MASNLQGIAVSTTNDSNIETLNLAKEQMAWLQSLFSAIKNDAQGHDVKNLSALGYFLTDMWGDSYSVARESLQRETV
jgi:hypothetical protein